LTPVDRAGCCAEIGIQAEPRARDPAPDKEPGPRSPRREDRFRPLPPGRGSLPGGGWAPQTEKRKDVGSHAAGGPFRAAAQREKRELAGSSGRRGRNRPARGSARRATAVRPAGWHFTGFCAPPSPSRPVAAARGTCFVLPQAFSSFSTRTFSSALNRGLYGGRFRCMVFGGEHTRVGGGHGPDWCRHGSERAAGGPPNSREALRPGAAIKTGFLADPPGGGPAGWAAAPPDGAAHRRSPRLARFLDRQRCWSLQRCRRWTATRPRGDEAATGPAPPGRGAEWPRIRKGSQRCFQVGKGGGKKPSRNTPPGRVVCWTGAREGQRGEGVVERGAQCGRGAVGP